MGLIIRGDMMKERMWNRRRALCLILFLLPVLYGCSTTGAKVAGIACSDYDCVKTHIAGLIREEMKKDDVPGLSIAIVDDRGLVWAEGFGYADKKKGASATAGTVYRVASISKLFTATAVMQLAEKGLIDIDKPLIRYLPEFSIKSRFPEAQPITPRNLMTHHAGLPATYYKGFFSNEPEPFANILGEIKDEYLAYPPEHVYSYSNLGMTVLGCLIERITGRDYASYMTDSILNPLGMKNSFFSPKAPAIAAKGYRNGKEADDFGVRDLPASGLFSSVLDLSLFMRAVLAGGSSGAVKILEKETLAEMLRPQNRDVPLDAGIPVGLGWALDGMGNTEIENGGPVAHHGGSLPAFNSQLLLLPKEKLGVVVLSNGSTRTVDKIATEALILALEAKSGIIPQAQRSRPSETAHPLPPDTIEAFAGYYATPIGLVKATAQSGVLKADLLGHRIGLVPRPDGRLAMKYKLLGLFPISLGPLDEVGISRMALGSREILLARSHSLDMVFGEKVEPGPIPEPWRARIGAYEVINKGNDILFFDNVRIGLQDGFLVVKYRAPLFTEDPVSIPISPISDDEAIILGLGSGMGETIQIVDAKGTKMLRYSGYYFRKIDGK